MSLSHAFTPAASGTADPPSAKAKPRRKRQAPFSLRLSEAERARLETEAGGAPLGSYIRAKVLGETVPVRMRRSGLAVTDRRSLAQLVAVLGRSRIAGNLNQLAQAAASGSLSLDPETLADLTDAVDAIREMRRLLIAALGLKPEGSQ